MRNHAKIDQSYAMIKLGLQLRLERYNKRVFKQQGIDQSQSNVRIIIEHDWLIPYDSTLTAPIANPTALRVKLGTIGTYSKRMHVSTYIYRLYF